MSRSKWSGLHELVTLGALFAGIYACGMNGSFDNGNQGADARSPAPGGTPKPSPSPGPAPAPGPAPSPAPATPEGFFLATVKPAMKTKCESCHVDGGTTDPLGDYAAIKARLLDPPGSTATTNYLFTVSKGGNTKSGAKHGGGNTCSKGDDQPPCKEMQEWWTKENATSGSGGAPTNGTSSGTGTASSTATGTGTGTGTGTN